MKTPQERMSQIKSWLTSMQVLNADDPLFSFNGERPSAQRNPEIYVGPLNKMKQRIGPIGKYTIFGRFARALIIIPAKHGKLPSSQRGERSGRGMAKWSPSNAKQVNFNWIHNPPGSSEYEEREPLATSRPRSLLQSKRGYSFELCGA